MTIDVMNIFRTNGIYFGFIKNGLIFSRDGEYLGWIEGKYAWDSTGKFRGAIFHINNTNYLLRDRFSMPPMTKPPKPVSDPIAPQPSLPPIAAINLPVNLTDAF